MALDYIIFELKEYKYIIKGQEHPFPSSNISQITGSNGLGKNFKNLKKKILHMGDTDSLDMCGY